MLLDHGGSLEPFVALSNDVTGRVNDDLDVDREDVGSITIWGKKVPVLLARCGTGNAAIWKVARETPSQLALATVETAAQEGTGKGAGYMIAGAPIKDWLLLTGLAAASFAALWFLASIVLLALRKLGATRRSMAYIRTLMRRLLPLSLMGIASRRSNRNHAFFMPRPKRALPSVVLPVLPSLRVCLSNRW